VTSDYIIWGEVQNEHPVDLYLSCIPSTLPLRKNYLQTRLQYWWRYRDVKHQDFVILTNCSDQISPKSAKLMFMILISLSDPRDAQPLQCYKILGNNVS
jgi:hypothetical protein